MSLFAARNRLNDYIETRLRRHTSSISNYNKNKEKKITQYRFKEKQIQGKKKFPWTG